MRLPILQRKIARYLSLVNVPPEISYDEEASEIVDIVVEYLNEQFLKKTELDFKTFTCENSIDDEPYSQTKKT